MVLSRSLRSLLGLCFFALPALGLGGGCSLDGMQAGAGSDQDCVQGQVGCFCTPQGSCDGRLVCVSDRCVDLVGVTGGEAKEEQSQNEEQDDAASPKSASNSVDTTGSPSQSSSSSATSDEENESPEPVSCSDGQKNGEESDVDCGGPDCGGCKVGQSCQEPRDCRSQICEEGLCKKSPDLECSQDSDCDDKNPCTADHCSSARRCEHSSVPNGQACNDANACTSGDLCQDGACIGQDTRVFEETFSKAPYLFLNGLGSALGKWEIAKAKVSSCAMDGFVEDPAQDHTQDGVNQLMGVSVGGCQSTQHDNHQDCAWSDEVDVSHFEGDVVFSYWRHLSSPGRDPVKQGIPMVTNSIFYRVPQDPTPKLIEQGWAQAINDQRWTLIHHRIPSTDLKKVAFGICYKRLGSQGGFAGWSVDDVRIRQFGCEMKR